MTMPTRISEEEEQVRTRYYEMFGEADPLHFVGFARIYRAFEEKKPVPFAEYEKYEDGEDEPPNHCCASTAEDEKLIIEYEQVFQEECPYFASPEIDAERIRQAIKEKKPVNESEYQYYLTIV